MKIFSKFDQKMLTEFHYSYNYETESYKFPKEVRGAFYEDIIRSLKYYDNDILDIEGIKKNDFNNLKMLFEMLVEVKEIQEYYFSGMEREELMYQLCMTRNISELNQRIEKTIKEFVSENGLKLYKKRKCLDVVAVSYMMKYTGLLKLARKLKGSVAIRIILEDGSEEIYYKKNRKDGPNYKDCVEMIVYQFVYNTNVAIGSGVIHKRIKCIEDKYSKNILWENEQMRYNIC